MTISLVYDTILVTDFLQLVLGGHVDQFSYDYNGCKAVNPGKIVYLYFLSVFPYSFLSFLSLMLGSFSSDYSFIVYRPATKDVEFSRIPD
jgi:hypothetical protein